MKWVIVFCSMFVLDMVWVVYIQATAEKRAPRAAIASGLTVAIGAMNTMLYVQDWHLIAPLVLGAMFGTFAA